MTYKEKLKKIFNTHSASEQLKKLSEEVFELQEAILDYEYSYNNKQNITEELADVMVILNQIMLVYDLDENDITRCQKYKIDRQCRRDGIDA